MKRLSLFDFSMLVENFVNERIGRCSHILDESGFIIVALSVIFIVRLFCLYILQLLVELFHNFLFILLGL